MSLPIGKPEEVGMLSDRLDYAKIKVNQWIEEEISPAFVASIARKGKVVFRGGFGQQCPGGDYDPKRTDAPVPADVIFPLYSISKAVTATLAMTMMEDGLFSVNRHVGFYVPEFVGEGKGPIYVHQLMTHTSGAADGMWDYVGERQKEYEAAPDAFNIPSDMEPWLYFACQAPLGDKPGTAMHYSSFGFDLLGLILSRISGKSLDTLLRERLFEPLGMKDSYLEVPESVWDRVYQFPSDGEWGDDPNRERRLKSTSAANGIYSTVDDMQIFAQMLLNGGSYNGTRILSPITVDYMTRNYLPGVPAVYGDQVFPEAYWGLGWNIAGDKLDEESGPLKSPSAYVHGGAGRCMLWIDPQYELAGILFYPKMPPQWRRFDDYFRNIVMSAITDRGIR